MIHLDFQIKPDHLVYHTIVNCSPETFIQDAADKKVIDFQNAAWHKDKQANDFIRFGWGEEAFLDSTPRAEIAARAEQLIQYMQHHPSFVPILQASNKALVKVRDEWEHNYHKTHNIVSELMGFEPKGEFRVFITHPSLKQGLYFYKLNVVCWTYRLDWSNYNTIYLWHEVLHGLLRGGALEHCVDQMITDNEMRVRLNGGTYPPFEGHPGLQPTMQVLLPHWQEYMTSKQKNIHEFITNMAHLPDVKAALAKSSLYPRQSSPK